MGATGDESEFASSKRPSVSAQPPRATDSAGLKLRNSCVPCANSKVRCNKAKPTCSRCEERFMTCHYERSKRPGRVPGSGKAQRAAQAANQTTERPKSSAAAADLAATTNNPNHNMISAFLPSSSSSLSMEAPSSITHYTTDAFFGCPSSGSDTTFVSNNMNSGGVDSTHLDVDDLIYSSYMDCDTDLNSLNFWSLFDDNDGDGVDFSAQMTETPSQSHGPRTSSSSCSLSDQSFFGPSSSSSSGLCLVDLPSRTVSSLVSSGSNPKPSTSPPLDVYGSTKAALNSAVTSCNCMLQALELLKTLSDVPSPQVPTAGAILTQRILAENKQAIDTATDTLACHFCVNDKFLLMMLFMITTKILARYASAASFCGAQSTGIGSDEGDPMRSSSPPVYRDRSFSYPSDHANQLAELSRAWGGNYMLLPTLNCAPDEQLSPRQAVQPVLRELHRVQRLIAQLSTRRQTLNPQDSSVCLPAGLLETRLLQARDNHNDVNDNSFKRSNRIPISRNASFDSAASFGSSSNATTPPLSACALDLVEGDVRRNLRALSAVLRGVLQNS